MTAIAFCFDGCTIAVGTMNGGILVYNLKERGKNLLEIKGQEGKKINALHFSKQIKEGDS